MFHADLGVRSGGGGSCTTVEFASPHPLRLRPPPVASVTSIDVNGLGNPPLR